MSDDKLLIGFRYTNPDKELTHIQISRGDKLISITWDEYQDLDFKVQSHIETRSVSKRYVK